MFSVFFDLGDLDMSFSFQTLEGFSSYLSVTDLQFNSTVIKKHNFCDSNSFKLTEISLMIQNIVFVVNVPCAPERNVFPSAGCNVLWCQVKSVGSAELYDI